MSTPGLISPRPSFFDTKTEMSQGAQTLAEMIDISLQRYLGHNALDGTETSRSEATSEVQLKLDERGLPQSNQQNIHVWKKRVKEILNRKCVSCDSMKPPRTHHCRVCNRCIVRMDHHCPWINNCVGFYNQKHFLQFLVIASVSTAYSALFLMIKIGLTFADGDIETLVGNPVSKLKIAAGKIAYYSSGLLSVMCSILFFYFALSLFFDQLSCIAHNTSAIDRIQTRKLTTKLTFQESFQEVFGSPMNCSWFLPTSVKKKIQPEEEYLWANLN